MHKCVEETEIQNIRLMWKIQQEEFIRTFQTFCFQIKGKLHQRTQNKIEKCQENISLVVEFYFKIKQLRTLH